MIHDDNLDVLKVAIDMLKEAEIGSEEYFDNILKQREITAKKKKKKESFKQLKKILLREAAED